MRIGADEIIVWLRKSDRMQGVRNDRIGRNIRRLIEDDLGGHLIIRSRRAPWPTNTRSQRVSAIALPIKAAQYEISYGQAIELFRILETWH